LTGLNEAFQSLVQDLVPDGKVAIDLGIGPGRISSVLLDRGFEVYGCDIEPAFAEQARARGVLADAADVLAWEPPVTADVITCMELIEHLPPARQPELLARMRRWVRPGGTALISTPQRHSVVATVERGYWAVKRRPYDWWDPTHIGIRRHRDLRRLFADAGFTVERTVGLHLVPELAGRVLPPLARHEWTRQEGPLAALCFDLAFVLR
jgi:2-polyprenyl-3-methyl-5-hydroxy-6-metoxy-1,4-benzoquinol methylase